MGWDILGSLEKVWDFGDKALTTVGNTFSKIDAEKLKGWGAVAQALGGIYGTMETKKFNDKMYGMEKKRIDALNKKSDDRQEEYESVWGASTEDN